MDGCACTHLSKPTKLRKITAILLLLIFSWAQYVKQAIYLECRLAAGFKSYAVVCDCEKKAGPAIPVPGKGPLSTAHSHIHPDDLFPFVSSITGDFTFDLSGNALPAVHHLGPYGHWVNELLRPPRPFHT